jgi:hypothetical protein
MALPREADIRASNRESPAISSHPSRAVMRVSARPHNPSSPASAARLYTARGAWGILSAISANRAAACSLSPAAQRSRASR